MTQTIAPQTRSQGRDSAESWRARDAAVVSSAYYRYTDLVVERAEGAHLHTVDGRDVLDFGSGIGVVNLGHNHPAVVAAAREQLGRLWHTSVTAMHPSMIELAEALVRIAPEGLDRVFLCNSGAEAVEAAIKLARKSTGRSELLAFDGAFHGRTFGAVSLTASRSQYHAGIGPLLPGIHHVGYPDCASCPRRDDACCRASGQDIEHLFETRVNPSDVAAIVVEPVLGEGGYVVPPAEFLPALRRLCDAHGILLVVDEVQSGMGRTGRMFAIDHTGVRPDILVLAKGLGNGLPIAAVLAPRAVMEAWQPGDHGTTFGGNAVACAAAKAVIETIQGDGVCARAASLGERVLERIRGWQAWAPGIADVRGLGLMIGVDFRRRDGGPDPDAVKRVRGLALERGLLLLSCGTAGNVIRLAPPLTISEADLDAGLDIMEAAVREVAA